ncbi:HD-GYP domain-containing protein [Pseudomonas sp.]|jgi:putative nucleotidyltransferase with HDIG domain|uniref:HD-GYP domain-containing protein n=1 Tax=Pseudomonas sp. TaxID=306 RepID=UPI00272BCDE9|nr:HD-GYP domain-containing protein [Pseudomonas sp.]
MLKTIPLSQARKGMYVHKFCGSWIDHPFWGRRLLIEDDDQLRQIRSSRIKELVIDLTRGVDVLDDRPLVDAARVTADVERFLQPDPPATQASEARGGCSLEDELGRARRIVSSGKGAVVAMFADVRMGRAVSGEGLAELIEDMSNSIARNPHALISVARIKHKDEYTYMHSVAVAALMVALARRKGLPEDEVRLAGLAGLLHDLGKAMMPEAVLNKPGKLTEAEFAIMRTHPLEGYKLLQEWEGIPEEVLDVCLHHHEKLDGTGYPEKLQAGQISLLARMGAICDVYDAITSNRPYKPGWDPAESLRQMASWKHHFDPELFRLFVHMLGIYPVGSLVRLSDEHLAVVVEQGRDSLTRPRLSVFYSIRLRQGIPVRSLDLAAPGVTVEILGRESPSNWGLTNLEKLWLNT